MRPLRSVSIRHKLMLIAVLTSVVALVSPIPFTSCWSSAVVAERVEVLIRCLRVYL